MHFSFFLFHFSLCGLQPLVRKKCIKHRAISSGKLAIPVCYGLFRIIPVKSAQFQSNRPNSGRIGLVPAYSGLLRPVPANYGLFQLIDSRRHMVKLAKGFILLLSSACLCSCSSGVCLGSPPICGICLGAQPIHGFR